MANSTKKQPRGYLICRVCGKREPQYTYDCDVPIVCKACTAKIDFTPPAGLKPIERLP